MDQLTLRWRNGDHSLVPADPNEPFRWTPEWTVEELLEDGPARRFVEVHHYARSWVPARFRYGLFRKSRLVGVAVFSHPQNDRALTNIWPSLDTWEACELGRLVLLDGECCPGNSESAFVAETFRRLQRDHMQAGVVSFSDPIPRARFGRSVVLPGHVGIVYQSVSTLQGCARLVGRSAARIRRILPDGTEIPPRGLTKIRKDETGAPSNIERLVAAGATPPRPDEDRTAWVRHWLPRVTTPLRHPGNYKYAWGFRRGLTLTPNPQDFPAPVLGRVPPRWGRRAA